ncbi:MAG: menaquinone biosynthesis protein [Chthoniobacterales bacterium]|nr:menaquinone biosynthesis protein [Chthoniobacterales bacterium]
MMETSTILTSSQAWNLGSVPYLNAQPLLYGLSCKIRKETPAQLWEAFQKGEVDAGLLSSYNALHLEESAIVDDIAIASCGEVYSVILAYEGELKNVKQILLDPASHTANNLLQIILKEFYGLTPAYVSAAVAPTLSLPRLLIGDPAIAFRQHASCSFMDLGAEWFRFTQLPFVFATWCLNKKSSHHPSIVKQLQQAKHEGLLNLKELALQQPDPDFALRYWTQYISYELGNEEWKGLKLFGELLKQHHLMRIT